jgi:predicted esterase YcpF (UPF0227 family)
MGNYILETKNYTIASLGEVVYEESEYCCNQYLVYVKDIDCLDILFEFEGNELVCLMLWNQENETLDGQTLMDFTSNIAKLIENDVIDIVKFMNKHLQY